jgi:diaminohydroxyphosphoribosylaminopyrimidine deaminase / 5-amino-6-(5-phosphoribosylamino)uracil reductase
MHDVDLSPDDEAHLELAKRLARRGWGQVHPNPMVGCVLVREGRIVGQGSHEVFGGPHSEIVALEEAGSDARGATAYVSLEPCDHHGKTPPCAEALARAGVARVVYGAPDPGSDSGGGGDTLRTAGIDVLGPVWPIEVARAQNPAFFHTSCHASPYVALKLAMSMDARISSAPGVRTRITGVDAEIEVHRLRTGFDAVMVGAGTVRADDPRLTSRLVPSGRQPTRRVVLVSDARVPADAALLQEADRAPAHVFCRDGASEAAIARLEASGAHVHPVAASPSGLDLDAVLDGCWEIGIRSILCEGGAALTASLLRERRVHRLYLFLAPTTLGEGGAAAFPGGSQELVWHDFRPALPPAAFGRDTLIVLDRQEG